MGWRRDAIKIPLLPSGVSILHALPEHAGFLGPNPLKRNLVPTVRVLFILSAMTQKHRFWLLALFLATLAFSSCMNQEGVGPAEGELKTPGTSSGGY
jgi:hypothetical protein